MSAASFVELVQVIATDLSQRRDELNRLDAVAGDGDLGVTVATGARALLDLAPELESLSEAEAIRRCGTEIARRAPSTGGTLVAFALIAAAKASVDPDASPVSRSAAYLEAAAESVAARGKVGPGDRTMLDALRPAAEAIRRAADSGESGAAAVEAAARAAEEGARATASMAAKVGRAGWLADRAAGHEDAGARLVALAFRAATDPAAGLS
jgi:dihydroxyacetone kinase